MLGDPVIRLVGGPAEHIGRVEVYDRESDQWGTVCYNDILYGQNAIANLVCKNLFGTYSIARGTASLSNNIQPSTNNPIVNGYIYCGYRSGVYDYFNQCPNFPLNPVKAMSRCTPEQELVLVCHCKLK